MRSTFSLTFYPKKQTVYKDGTCPIMARVRVSGSLADFSTKLKIRPAVWSKTKGKATGSSQEIIDLNAALSAIEAAITAISKDLLIRNSYVTAFQIRDAYLELTRTEEDRIKEEARQRKAAEEEAEREKAEAEERERREQGISLITFFDRYNYFRKDEVKAEQLTNKTYSRYLCARDRLVSYMEDKYNVSDMPMKDIDFFFIRGFEMWLRSNCKNKAGNLLKNNTVMKIVQKLTTILTLAHDEGVMTRNASKNYQLRFEQTDRERLEADEIFKLYTYQFASKTLEEVKDSYLFGCHTGICFCDASEIRECNIFTDANGKEMIKYKRHKTGVEFIVPLTSIPKQIIEKYRGKLADGRLVPMFANQTMNRYLQEIANITGINKHLTYHCFWDVLSIEPGTRSQRSV